MTNEEIIDSVQKLEIEARRIGYEYLNNHLPIEVGKFAKQMKPFIKIEQAFSQAITELKKRNP